MALFFADLVREACWDLGASDLTLGGALPGHRAFAAAVPVETPFHYAIRGVTHPDEWETGEGEIGEDGKLVRTPIASSVGGAAVDFSAGLKTIALSVNADWFAARDGGVATIEDIAGLTDALAAKAAADHGHSFASLTGKPSTLAGYGITDAATSDHDHDADYARRADNLSDVASAAAARTNLGLGSIATQAAASIAITGGAISGLSALSTAGAVGIGIAGPIAPLDVYQAGEAIAFVRTANQTLRLRADDAGNRVEIANSAGNPLEFSIGATMRARVSTAGLEVNGAVAVGGSQVVAARRTGWATPSGTAARSGFDTASVTTGALAERLKALIDDLAAHGLIGS